MTHDLIALQKMCQATGFVVPVEEDELSLLSIYAVKARYPGDNPTAEEARMAFGTAKAVRKFARKLLATRE